MLTIIVPAHNAENTIERCVNSILVQDIKELEVIIIENASTDNTLKKCYKIAEKDNRVIVYHNDEAGTSKARNIGLKYAQGDIIGFCDADDYVERFDIGEICYYFNEEKYDILVFGYNLVDMNGNLIKSNIESGLCIDSSESLIRNVLFNKSIMGSLWNKFFRAEILKKIYFDENLSYCEDTHFIVKVLDKYKNLKVKYIPRVIYNYVNNMDSVTNNYVNVFNDEQIKYVQAMEKIRSDCKLSDENTRILNLTIANLCITMFFILVINPRLEPEKRKIRFEYIYGYLIKYKKIFLNSNCVSAKQKIMLRFILMVKKIKIDRFLYNN